VDDASTCTTAPPGTNELWTRHRWSEADWDALDHDTSRVELVDGMVRRRARPDTAHQQVKAALRATLARLAPAGFAVATDIEVRLAEIHRRRPDVVVVAATALDHERWHVDPEEVLLAAEVVAPGSETTDRKHKPIEYADADIGHYWRVETAPIVTVHTYRLGESSHYLETGIFRPGDRVSDPTLRWAEFEVDELLGASPS
jgi:Uma2 family endonuclease